jgi:hypothetical protein
MSWPSFRIRVALPVPTMAGNPSSRLTIAACDVRPPWSVTIAAARFMIGSQSGSVISVTRISPSSNVPRSVGSFSLRTLPAAMALPMLTPVSRRRPLRLSVYVLSAAAAWRDCTVSGRA